MPERRSLVVLLCLVLLKAGLLAGPAHEASGQSPSVDLSHAVGAEAMVSSAHPLASQAGKEMLEEGGNAVDAAVATAFALAVAEPNMSGLGGGGSMLIWSSEQDSVAYGDFYSAKPVERFRGVESNEDEEFDLLSTGVPGTVDGLLEALDRHGTMERSEVMQPAIRLAEKGIPTYLTLAEFIATDSTKLTRYDGARDTFWPDGKPLAPGEMLTQPDLAQTLDRVKSDGRSAFYEGEIAESIVEVLNEAGNPITREDFSNYASQWDKQPLCGTYQGRAVLSAPPPQTGMQVIKTLHLLDEYQLRDIGLPTQSAEAFDILTSSLRVGMADRRPHVSDPKWTDVPALGMTTPSYASSRSDLVGTGTAPDSIAAGEAAQYNTDPLADGCETFSTYDEGAWADRSITISQSNASSRSESSADRPSGETTHLSVVDEDGNAVSLSTTLSPVFGSGAWAEGILLNTSGYNFEHMEDDETWEGHHPFRVRASTISPTIILDEDREVELVIGAPGGVRIPTAVIQNIVYLLDYGIEPLDAVEMPRIFPSPSSREVEIEGGIEPDVLHEARSMGYDLQTLSPGYARMYLVKRDGGEWVGISDPRHDGQPRGY